MNNEIKEMNFSELLFNRDERLLDYITNLQEENEHLRTQLNTYKNVIDKAVEFIEEKISSTKGVINDYMYHKEHNKHLIELLREDVDMYKKELNILQGEDNDKD